MSEILLQHSQFGVESVTRRSGAEICGVRLLQVTTPAKTVQRCRWPGDARTRVDGRRRRTRRLHSTSDLSAGVSA